jgi:multidrug efflux system outer membrane protein
VGGEFEREGESETSGSGDTENEFFLAGLVSWEIDLWGANRRSTEAAEAQWQAVLESREALEVSLIGEIATAYFDLLDIDNRLEISELTVETRSESLRIARLRKKGGVISELEVQQAELELAKAESTMPSLRRNRLVKENQLCLLLGRAPGQIERGLDLSDQPLSPEVPAGLPSSLLQRRPDIRQAEQELIAANARIGVAEAEYFPKVELTGSYGRESNELNELLDIDSRIWTLGVDVSMPLFTAGRISAQVAIAREQCEQARLNYRLIVLRALREVSDALESYYRSREELEVRQRLLEASREYVRLANLKYYNGILSYLEFLDAQRQLFDAELSMSEAKLKRLAAFVQVYKALGGGWQDVEPQEADAAAETD